jgi:hypothetical protein
VFLYVKYTNNTVDEIIIFATKEHKTTHKNLEILSITPILAEIAFSTFLK